MSYSKQAISMMKDVYGIVFPGGDLRSSEENPYNPRDPRHHWRNTTNRISEVGSDFLDKTPKELKEVAVGVTNVIAKGLFGYTDANGNYQKGLLHSDMNALGLQPVDALRLVDKGFDIGASITGTNRNVVDAIDAAVPFTPTAARVATQGVKKVAPVIRRSLISPVEELAIRQAAVKTVNSFSNLRNNINLPGGGASPQLAMAGGGSMPINQVSDLSTSAAQPLQSSMIDKKFTKVPRGLTGKEGVEALGGTKWYNRLRKEYKYISPEEIVGDRELMSKMKKQELVLDKYTDKLEVQLKDKSDLLTEYPDPKTRPDDIKNKLGNIEDAISATRKNITETAGENPLVSDRGSGRIFGKENLRKEIKKNFPEFDDNLNRWHHIHGSADLGKTQLAKLMQDPYIKVNLFAHWKKIDLFSSGTIDNLALIKEMPHNQWHNEVAKKLGIEPTVFNSNLGRWRRTEAVFYQLMEDCSEAILRGEANVNELFTLSTVYKKAQDQINKELFGPKYNAKRFSDIEGLREFINQSKVSEGRIERSVNKELGLNKTKPKPKSKSTNQAVIHSELGKPGNEAFDLVVKKAKANPNFADDALGIKGSTNISDRH